MRTTRVRSIDLAEVLQLPIVIEPNAIYPFVKPDSRLGFRGRIDSDGVDHQPEWISYVAEINSERIRRHGNERGLQPPNGLGDIR